MAKQDDYVRYTIRIPAELYDVLKEAAGPKSVNAEITERLSASFSPYADPEAVAKAYEQGRRDAGAPDAEVTIPLTAERFDKWFGEKFDEAWAKKMKSLGRESDGTE